MPLWHPLMVFDRITLPVGDTVILTTNPRDYETGGRESDRRASTPFDCLVPTPVSMEGSGYGYGYGPLSGLSFVAKNLFAVEGHTSVLRHSR